VSKLRHAGLLYASLGEFAAGVAGFVQTAMRAGDPAWTAVRWVETAARWSMPERQWH
jgi:hypothetical protein